MSGDSWWDNPDAGSGGVVAHTPDPTKYHLPDSQQARTMRSGIGSGVIIPRANDDGTSQGFYGSEAGVVHVDPNAPDGGTVVDLRGIRAEKLYSAFANAQYPHQVFYQLGVSVRDGGKNMPGLTSLNKAADDQSRNNPYVPPNTYLTPSAGVNGAQQLYYPPIAQESILALPPMPQFNPYPQQPQPQYQQPQQAPVPPQQQAAPVEVGQPAFGGVQPTQYAAAPPQNPYAPQPQLAYQPPHPQQPQPQPTQYYQPMYQQPQQPQPVPPGQYDQLMGAVTQLASVVNNMAQRVQSLEAPRPPLAVPPIGVPKLQPYATTSRPKAAEEVEEVLPPQTTADLEDNTEPRPGVIAGFETLDIPFLNGPRANKPKQTVFFELPNAGMINAVYHQVIVDKNCIALVYDTRYTEGGQYVPPDLGDQKIRFAIDNGGKKLRTEMQCCSMGLHYALGKLDIIILVKTVDDAADQG